MPIQDQPVSLWERLGDARDGVTVARNRLDSSEDEFDRVMAAYDLDHAETVVGGIELELAAVAVALFGMLVKHGGAGVKRHLEAAFGGVGLDAHEKAKAAGRRATRAVEELDALRQRVRELEAKVADLTPGVGRGVGR